MSHDYDGQADAFVKATSLVITKEYDGHRCYFEGDDEKRAVWRITFAREGRKPYVFTFGESLVESYNARDYRVSSCFGKPLDMQEVLQFKGAKKALRNGGGVIGTDIKITLRKDPPSDYSILATVAKSDPGTFEDFCGDFGYDTDSIKARDTYFAVQREYAGVRGMFTPEEMEALQEIN